MVTLSPYDIFEIVSAVVSTGLAFIIAFYGFKSYKFTGRRYLLDFAVGFLLLGISFYLVALLLPPFILAEVTPGYEWPRLIVQTAGFALIAVAYYAKERRGETLALLVAVIALAVLLPVASDGGLNFIAFEDVDKYFFILNASLSLYVFLEAIRGSLLALTRERTHVLAGFAALALSQYTLALWAIDDGLIEAVISQVWRLIGLLLFTSAFLISTRRRELRDERG